MKTKNSSASTHKGKRPVYIEISDEKSPHHSEFPPSALGLGGIPFAVSVTERHDGSMVIQQGLKKEEKTYPQVQSELYEIQASTN